MKRRGRRPSPEKMAARAQALTEATARSVRNWLERGDLTAAVRIVLGRAERLALEGEAAEAVYPLQFKQSLTYQEQDRMREAFGKVVAELQGEIGLFLPGRKVVE